MKNNLTNEDINSLNEWLSHFTDLFKSLIEQGASPSMLGGEPITSWETVEKIWLIPNQEYIGEVIEFPEAISKLQTVTFIRIENIVIPELPEVITKLKNLKKIMFNNVQMASVPTSIGNLTNLISLDLNDNKITELPDEIANLVSLEEFGVSNNLLEWLPDAFSDMPNLARVFAYGNNISIIPESIELNIHKMISCEFQNNPIRNMSDGLSEYLGGRLKWRMPPEEIMKRKEALSGR